MKVCLSFFIFTSHSYFLNILRVENGDVFNAKRDLSVFTKLDIVYLARASMARKAR